MPYVVSLLIIFAATVALVVLVLRLAGPVRRLTLTALLCRAHIADHIGLLTARIAGLKVELARRRHVDTAHPDSR